LHRLGTEVAALRSRVKDLEDFGFTVLAAGSAVAVPEPGGVTIMKKGGFLGYKKRKKASKKRRKKRA
jgi:hypothetical protein